MKSAVVLSPHTAPVYRDFPAPAARPGCSLVRVTAAALSQVTRGRASGSHYSADGSFPAVPGVDGVGIAPDGSRVYFALPEAPYGTLAEQSLVKTDHCIAVPDGIDDVTAAAIANPGMSAWPALVERARFQAGEAVLVNGATGTAGRLAVQIAKLLGARRVIATGRNAAGLAEVEALGADDTILLENSEEPLIREFASGVDVVLDYLWGPSALHIMSAVAKGAASTAPVRFVHVGGASGENTIDLPGAALRSSPIVLMGSGFKSVPFAKLLSAVGNTFDAFVSSGLQIACQAVPLAEVERYWTAPGKPRIVFTVE